MSAAPVRLDHAVSKLIADTATAKSPSDVSPADLKHFEASLRRQRVAWREKAAGGLSELLFDALMPRLRNTSFLRAGRTLALLREVEGLLDDAAEEQDEDDDLGRWAKLVVEDEIRKQELLWQHINDLVES